MHKTSRRRLNGLLLLDKATGISSNKALQQVKHLYGALKAGHTGSLDPLASGMLPICFGEATKYSQYLLDANKEYYVIGQLGIKTTSGDSEGEIIEERTVYPISPNELQATINNFLGEITQIPPMYSALKHQGQPLYKLARKGIAVERKPRQVHIFNITILNHQPNQIALRVTCSKGTYIRTLIEDIGEKLGCGAHVTVLRRLSVAHYKAEHMISFAALIEHDMSEAGLLDKLLLPIDALLPNLPIINVSLEQAARLRHGQPIPFDSSPNEIIKLYAEGEFIGLGKGNGDKILPERLVVI